MGALEIQVFLLGHHPLYVLCQQEEETIDHLLLHCSFSRQIWFVMHFPLDQEAKNYSQ